MIRYFEKNYDDFIMHFKKDITDEITCREYKEYIEGLDISLYVYSEELEMDEYLEPILETDAPKLQACILTGSKKVGVSAKNEIAEFKQKKQRAQAKDQTIDVPNVSGKNSDMPTAQFYLTWVVENTENVNEAQWHVINTVLQKLKVQVQNLKSMESPYNWEAFSFYEEYFTSIQKKYNIPNIEQLRRIASLPYERRPNTGIMCVLSDEEWKTIEGKAVTVKNPSVECNLVDKNYMDEVRKLLEISNANYKDDERKCILFDKGMMCRGIALEKDVKKDNLLICFEGSEKWGLFYNDLSILRYESGDFYIGRQQQDDEYESKLPSGIKNKGLYLKILDCLKKQSHGALMIIADDAKRETDRLCAKYNRGTLIEPYQLNEQNLSILSGFCSVDGAIFMDLEGRCYGYGVILDGEAKIGGIKGRGARYNSAANYITGMGRYAVVVSEDKEKGLEIIPPNKYKII